MKSARRLLVYAIVCTLLVWPIIVVGDEAKFFYDELGRLTTVIDGSGNMAVYHYDAVGNILSIERFDVDAGGIGIFFLQPESGGVGVGVLIRGFGFSTIPTDNQVAFNGIPATAVSATETTIVATVPIGTITGPVTVTNANGTATSAPFIIVTPTVTGISPNRAAQGSSTLAEITGKGLTGATDIQFADPGITVVIRPVPQPSAESLSIDLTVGAAVPPGNYTFTVDTPNGKAESGTVTVGVAPIEPSFNVAPPVGVYLPSREQVSPSGSTMTVAPPVGIQFPPPPPP